MDAFEFEDFSDGTLMLGKNDESCQSCLFGQFMSSDGHAKRMCCLG